MRRRCFRRRGIPGVAQGVAAALVAAAAAGCASTAKAAQSGTVPATTTPPALVTTAPAGSYGIADPVPGQEVRIASFVDPTDGFGLAGTTIVSTFDGGLTWSAAASATESDHGSDLSDPSTGSSGILFITKMRGWVWGPDATGTGLDLSTTTDGGHSWTEVHGIDNVVGMYADGRSVWVVTSPHLTQAVHSGSSELWVSDDSGTSWHSAGPIPAGSGSVISAARTGPSTGDVLLASAVSGVAPQLLITSDSGATWSTKSSAPKTCSAEGSPPLLAAEVPGQIWLACPSEPGAGEQAKAVYRSNDGGTTWMVVGSTSPPPPHQMTAGGRLPLDGFITQFAVVSTNVAYLALGRGALVETANGGTTWSTAASNRDAAALGVVLAPINATDSVALIAGQAWETSNGINWMPAT